MRLECLFGLQYVSALHSKSDDAIRQRKDILLISHISSQRNSIHQSV